MIVLTTAFSGCAAAHSGRAPWWLLVLSLGISIALGLGIALLSGRLAYAILAKDSKGTNAGIRLLFYLICPVPFLLAGMALAIVSMTWLTNVCT